MASDKEVTNLDPRALWAKRELLCLELSKLDLQLDCWRQQDRHVVRAEELVSTEGESSVRAAAVISPEVGFNIHNFRVFKVEVPPKSHRGRYHMHGEAVKCYLSGRAVEYVGEQELQVKAGDFALIPANTWHGTQNPYDQPVKGIWVLQIPGTYLQTRAAYLYPEEPHLDLGKPLTTETISQMSPGEVYEMRDIYLHHLSKLEVEIDRLREKRLQIRRAEELMWEDAETQPTPLAEGQRYCHVVSPEMGFDIHTFQVLKLEQPPHSRPGRYHTHGEAVKHYLSGRAIERIGDKEYEVKAGDFCFIPANTWHSTENPYDEPVQTMAILQMPGTYVQVPARFMYQEVLL